jgi:zinc and cadmium transporter
MAAGALMATAFMHLLPEAFESGLEPHDLFLALLIGLACKSAMSSPRSTVN